MSAPAVDLKKPVQEPQTEKEVQKGLSDDACVLFSPPLSTETYRDQELIEEWPFAYSLTKYTSAGQALGEVLKKLIPQITPGKKVLDLCIEYVFHIFSQRGGWCVGIQDEGGGRGKWQVLMIVQR